MNRCVPHNVNWKIKASTLLPRSLQAFCRLIGKPCTAPSFLAVLSGVCVALMLPTGQAATLTWAGGTWNSTSSWSPAQIPVNGDDLIFNTASATATNNFANNALTLNSITFSASGQTLGQSATNGINIGAGGVTAGNSTGTSAMVLGVTLTANQTWSVGTGSTVTLNRGLAMGNNTITKTGAGTLRLTNNAGTSSAGSQFLVQNGILEALYQNDIKSTTAIVLGGGGNATQLKITDGTTVNRLTNLQSAISIAAGTTGAVTINNAVLSSVSDVTLSGNIALGTSTDADLVFNTTTGSVTKLTGTISGSMTNANNRGNIQFSGGNGEVQFNSANNSFSGVRTFGIQQGVVVLGANDPATGSSNGALGNNTTGLFVGTSASPNSGVASLLMDGAFTSGRAITVGNSANANSVTYTLGGRTAHDSVFSGGITMNRDVQLTAANGGNVTFSGILNDASNTQSVTKVGNGTVILTRANTYDGSTTVSAGALTASNATALGSTTGGTTVANGAALQLSGSNAIGAEALSLTGDGISSGGALRNLSGTNSYAGAITLAGATRINSDAGTLTLGAGGISGTQNLTFGGAGDTSVSGVIGTSTGTLTKDGSGTLTLSGGNTYDGSTTVSVGALTASSATALGSTTGNTTVSSGAALQLSGGVAIGAEALSLTGDGISTGGALRNLSGTNSYAGAITLAGATRINSDAGTLTLGAGGISGTQNLTFGGAGNITVSGLLGISTGTLTKDGNGILTLGNGTGTSYTGATTVNAGTLVLQGAAYDNRTTSSSALTISTGATVNATFSGLVYSYFGSLAGNGTLIVGASGSANRMQVGFNNSNTTFSGLLNLANSNSFLFKTGTGALTLSGNNTGSIGQLKFGTTSDAANEIIFANAAAPGSMLLGFDVLGTVSASVAGVDLKGGVSFNNNGNFGSATNTNDILVSGAVDLGTTTRTITVSNNTTFSGVVSGNITNSVGFTKAGAGTLILSGNNTYVGVTTVSAGTLQLAKIASLYNGTTANWTAANIIVNSGATLALNVGGAGEFTSANVDTIDSLGGASNGLRSGSTLALDTTNAGGSFTHSGNISNTNGGANVLNFTKLGSGTLTLNGTNTYTGNTTISAGTLEIGGGGSLGSGAYSGNISNSGTFTLNTTAAQTLSGTVSGTGSLIKSNTNTVVLSGNNTYSGGTTLSAGTLQIGHANALGTTGTITLGGGTLQYGSGITTDLSSRFSTAASQAYNIDTGINNVTYASALTSSGGTLTKNGSGMLTLNNAGNTYSGATAINGGTLNLASSLTGSAITVNSGGALIGTATAGTVTVNSGGVIGAGSAAATPGTLTVGSLTLNGGSTYTWDFGNVSGTAGTNWDLLSVTNALTINATSGNKFTVAITGTPTGWAPSTSQTWNIMNYGSLANAFDASVFDYTTSLVGAGTWSFTNNSSSKFIGLTYTVSSTSTWNGSSGNWSSGFSATPANANALVFSGAGGTATNDIASGVLSSLTTITINSTAGSYTLAANSGSSGFNASTPLTITGVTNNSANATTVNLALAVTNSALAINAAAGNITMGGPISNNNTINFSGANSTTVSGAISGTGGIAQSGTGALMLSAANTYAGDTTISAGSLQITGSGSLGTGATYSGNISNSGTFTLNTTTDQTLAGILSGSGALVKSSTNTVILSGANTFTGNTTINAGTLRVNGTGTLGNATYAGTITNNGTLFFNSSTNQTLSGVISGTGGLTQNGSSTLTLTGNSNSYTGATTVNQGTLTLNGTTVYNNTTANSSALTIATGATVVARQDTTPATIVAHFGSLAGNGTLQIGPSQDNRITVGYNNSNTTFSGYLNSNRTNNFLNKLGAGALTLSGNNTGSLGQLKVVTTANAANEIVFGHAAAPGSMTLGFDVAGTVSASVAGVDVKGGVSFANSGGNFGSATNTNDILVSGAVDLGTTTRTITVSNNTTFSGNVTNTAGLIKAGAGTLILSGNNTYSGTTTVSNGILRASHANALGATGNGTTVSSGAALELSGGISIGAEALSLTGNGISSTGALRNIIGNNAYGGVISLAGATTIGSDAGNLTLSSGSSITGTNTNLTIVGSGNITINDAIATGTGTLTKNGTGTLTLGGSNSYTGATTLNTGNISFSTTAALANSSSLSMANATSLIYTGGAASLGSNITVTGGTGSTGTIRNTGGALTLSGALSKNGTTLTLAGGTNGITVSGVISGSNANSDLVIDGGTTTLVNANSYNGPTSIINGGTLNANFANALPTANLTAISIDATGTGSSTLALGANQQIASLTGAASSTVALGSNTITIGTTSGSTTYAGRITGGNASALVKDGASTQVLTGNNTGFTGTTTINSGTLQAASVNALGSNNTVQVNGGTLLVSADDAINGMTVTLNSTSTTVAALAFSGNYSGSIGRLTLSANSIIDLGQGNVGLAFADLAAGLYQQYTLSFYNWSGTTKWGTTYGNGTDTIFFGAGNYTASNVKFYWGAVGSDSFVGSGFEVMPQTTWEGGFTGHYILPVPEPETWATGILLLLGGAWWMIKRTRKAA